MRARVRAAQARLDGLLLAGYRRQPHVTVSLCGFPTVLPVHDDDFGAAALRAQLDALRDTRCGAFDITLGALASFASAPFLAVGDHGGALATLRRALRRGHAPPGDHPENAYVPHVTVGLYAGAWPTAAVCARLDAHPAAPPLACRIQRLSLMHYAARDIGGPLALLADYDLASGELRWHAPAPAALAAACN